MSQTTKRRLILAAIVLFALIVFGCLFLGHRTSHAPAQSQVDALNDALKNGLITKPQYDAEIKKLKDQPPPTPQSEP